MRSWRPGPRHRPHGDGGREPRPAAVRGRAAGRARGPGSAGRAAGPERGPAAAADPGRVEGRVLPQDRALEPLQSGPRFQAELADQDLAGRPVGAERFGLPPAAVQGEHQLPVQALAQRVHRDQRLELADDVGVTAQRQVGLDPVFGRAEPELLQPPGLHLRERLAAEVAEGGAAPELKRRAQARGSRSRLVRRELAAALPDQPLEPVRVELAVVDLQAVRTRPGQQHGRAESLAEPGDVHLKAALRARRRLIAPQVVDEGSARDRLVRVQQQDGQQPAQPGAADLDHAPVGADLDRPEDPIVGHLGPTPVPAPSKHDRAVRAPGCVNRGADRMPAPDQGLSASCKPTAPRSARVNRVFTERIRDRGGLA